jgi:hypothetical protein
VGWVGLVLEEGLFKTKAVNEEEEGFGWEGMIIKNTVNMVDTEEGFVSMLLHRDPGPCGAFSLWQIRFRSTFWSGSARKKEGQVPSDILRDHDLQMAKTWLRRGVQSSK